MNAAEPHHLGRRAWLRPAVLGANDGIVSTASLLVGMASGGASTDTLLAAGVAGLVAGATSMAAGEYVSVSSQRDLEEALLARQRVELHAQPDVEQAELAATIVARGVNEELAQEVARQLMSRDPLAVLARVRLGLSDTVRARPLLAALASAASFTAGALVPLGAAFVENEHRLPLVVGLALLALVVTGALSAGAGGASRVRAAARVVGGCGLAMAIAALIGRLVGLAL